MATVGTRYFARARADADRKLVEADDPLAELQQACGGSIGSRIAIPELLALVEKAQRYGLRLARQFEAIDGEKRITAWVEISPITDESGEADGCAIDVVSWHSEELPPENDIDAARRRLEINRHLADCTARLDSNQRLLSIDTEAADLVDFAEKAQANVGKPWTDLVRLPGNTHRQPLHWRLLDGARCEIDGSGRSWTAHLEPLGQPQPGSAGFVLYLTADSPLAEDGSGADSDSEDGPSFGRDLTPVLRQPINRIIANAETIRTKLAGPLADEYSSYASDIATAAQHLLALIDDLSDLEVVESEDFATAPDRIELADVARRACGILGVRAREKGITLVAPPEGESQLAIAEFRRVLQILLNLVGNAIRYSPDDSQVWIRLDRIGNRALITVADQGHGLEEEQQQQVFEKFERLGRSGDGGSGLGLYISRRIARAMDGDLTVESAPGQGARFTLSVPAAEDLREKPR
ncbi:HAMP domain-containing sensor histidine kinase [Erythrobacter sp.]|uniref:sensor histidine kinase n=1 Tax=Erythrobacter sp. TaxID=1042 RepID=UPI001B0FD57B|nr:HAMP domain-containing sensor histidine kinase [Erythrobacter sp.]MBO6526107.1 HAMP domain-containing histidine kinase [Erythrobacter sp.]MBO6531181.1 HAMP domain-containing histidine kinase [Erythrobacter sp.]